RPLRRPRRQDPTLQDLAHRLHPSTSVPDTPPALDTPCTPCTGPVYSTPDQVSVLTVTPSGGLPSGSPDDLVEEIFILRKEIERLKNEYQGLLNHTIESDTRLLQFTDEIFTVNNLPRVNQIVRASATVDCGIQCELPLDPPVDSAPPAVDFGVQCDLSQKPAPTVVCSHTRHITGLMWELTDSATSICGVCMPGARLLDIIKLNQSSPGPGPRCEVLIADTNDLAIGEQRNIYRHLEGFIAARQADAEFVVANLPHRYDLDPHLPVHDETVLVNAYIEKLAAWSTSNNEGQAAAG
ncbi:hypothetical protein J6590_075988, partial [Homalodisca vitripennis]